MRAGCTLQAANRTPALIEVAFHCRISASSDATSLFEERVDVTADNFNLELSGSEGKARRRFEQLASVRNGLGGQWCFEQGAAAGCRRWPFCLLHHRFEVLVLAISGTSSSAREVPDRSTYATSRKASAAARPRFGKEGGGRRSDTGGRACLGTGKASAMSPAASGEDGAEILAASRVCNAGRLFQEGVSRAVSPVSLRSCTCRRRQFQTSSPEAGPSLVSAAMIASMSSASGNRSGTDASGSGRSGASAEAAAGSCGPVSVSSSARSRGSSHHPPAQAVSGATATGLDRSRQDLFGLVSGVNSSRDWRISQSGAGGFNALLSCSPARKRYLIHFSGSGR